jgi:hypothetical protein
MCGAARRYPAREQRDQDEDQRHDEECHRVARRDAKQQGSYEMRHERKQRKPQQQAGKREGEALPGDHAADQIRRGAERNAHAELPRAKTHDVGNHTIETDGAEEERDDRGHANDPHREGQARERRAHQSGHG